MQDKLSDIEELAYYKKYHKSRTTLAIIVGILCFALGVLVGKLYYNDYPMFMKVKQSQAAWKKNHKTSN